MYASLSCQTDTHLHDNVQRELEWDPEVEAGDLAVVLSEGVITLTGVVHSLAAKLAAECAVKRVQDVRGVVNNIQVAGDVIENRLEVGQPKERCDQNAAPPSTQRGRLPASLRSTTGW